MQASFGKGHGSSPPRKYERANSIDEELMMSSSNSSNSSYDDHENGRRGDSYNRGGRSSSSSNSASNNRNSFRSANVESYNQVLRAFDSVSREDEDDDAEGTTL